MNIETLKTFLCLKLLCLLEISAETAEQDILKYLNPSKLYQMTVFLNNSMKSSKKLSIERIVKQFPTVSIDYSDSSTPINRSISMPVFLNPRKSTVYIIFAEENSQAFNLNKTYNEVIDMFVKT